MVYYLLYLNQLFLKEKFTVLIFFFCLSFLRDHVQFMFQYLEGISKVMIVDFDAHQGNGHERDFINDERVYIMDMYNRWIYPNDREAKGQCTCYILYSWKFRLENIFFAFFCPLLSCMGESF